MRGSLRCVYGIGSNIGLKRISSANADATYSELRYIKRRFISTANIKAAIVDVVNEIIKIRDPSIWGTGTTGVACDSTQVSAWDQNLMLGLAQPMPPRKFIISHFF